MPSAQKRRCDKSRYSVEGELTVRERDVLHALAEGYTYKQIADQRELSVHTVAYYIKQIYAKLNVHSRSQAIYRAVQSGFLRMREQ